MTRKNARETSAEYGPRPVTYSVRSFWLPNANRIPSDCTRVPGLGEVHPPGRPFFDSVNRNRYEWGHASQLQNLEQSPLVSPQRPTPSLPPPPRPPPQSQNLRHRPRPRPALPRTRLTGPPLPPPRLVLR